jgi:hypothetical protein
MVKHIWPRISEIAHQLGIHPMDPNKWPPLAAIGSDGQAYDVEEIIQAIKKL